MLNAREILRLNRAGLSLRDIAQSLSCGKSTVSEVLRRAERYLKIIDILKYESLKLSYIYNMFQTWILKTNCVIF